MVKIKISAVSYTNTKPFIYGLSHSAIADKIDLSLDNPSDCATKLIENEVDIGLVPIAALSGIPEYTILSDYCIGADGAVNSVFIFSDKPIEKIQNIRLDPQSRTSNALAQILLKHYWKVNVTLSEAVEADAFIEIGDRTFGKKARYAFVYDLAEEWKKFTGLPFVFAVWASNKPIDRIFLIEFNAALKFGITQIPQVILALPARNDFDLADYLINKVDYKLSEDKLKALRLFLSYLDADRIGS